MTSIEIFGGRKIIITDAITKKVRKRTHKKKRIDKKWLKRYGYKEVQDHSKMYVTDDYIFMSKQNYEKLENQLAKENENDS
jgi:hypothetical protein